MYLEKKRIKGKDYFYLKISVRVGDKVKTRTVAYLGKGPISKKQLDEKISATPNSKIEAIKKQLKEISLEKDINMQFLTQQEFEKMDEIKGNFAKKLKTLDKKLLEDMFRDFKTYYIYNTNAIEGNTLTLKETNLLLNENISPSGKDLREIYDHINGKETFDYLLDKKPEINIKSIIDLHARLLKNIDVRVGSFRRHNVRVFGASFKTSDAKYVETDMDLLLTWYAKNKKKLHPLILAAIFHEKFERIHPFYDGNGRTGRMLINLILLRAGLPPLIIQNKTRSAYYDVLSAGHKADLMKVQPEYYTKIVKFCYKQFLNTYTKIFSEWG